MAFIGWATDLKTASSELVRKRVLRTGKLRSVNNNSQDKDDNKCDVWGWDDPTMPEDDKKLILILNKSVDNNSKEEK